MYKVTLTTNGGTIAGETVASYTAGTETLLPDELTRPGYIFTGWYADETCSGDPVTSISADTRGDVTYYAGWRLKETISFSAEPQTGVYDGQAKEFRLTDTALGGFTVEYKKADASEYTTDKPVSAGQYDVRITRPEDDTYLAVDTVIEGGLIIDPKEVKLEWQPAAGTNFVYDGTAKTVSVSVAADSLVYGDSSTVTAAVTAGADNVNAGDFTFTATSLGNGNYRLPETVQSPVYTIAPKEIVIDWADDDFTYTGQKQTITASYKDIEGQTVQLAVTTDRTFKEAGSYTATADLQYGETNYKLPAAHTNPYEMKRADYDMSGVSFAVTSCEYNGQEQTVTLSGELPTGADGSRPEVSYEYSGDRKNVVGGGFTVTARFTTASSNYNTPEVIVSGTITITPKTIHVTADDVSSKQGKPLSRLTYEADALFAGDTFTGALTTDADIHTVDTYTITQGTLSAGTNYTIVFEAGTYTVYSKDTLTPDKDAQGTTYDGEGHDFAVTFDVEPITDTAVVVTYRLSDTEDEFSSDRPVNAGRYDVRITRAEDAEYRAVDVIITAGYVIDPKPVAEPVLTGSYTYNGRQQTAELSGVETYMTVSGDSGTAAATYTIRITLDGNHVWAEGADGIIEWTIGKGQAEIQLGIDASAGIEHTYGDSWTLPEAVCALGPVLCDRTETDMRDADTYTVTYSVAETDNYYGDSVSVTIRILPKEVTLVWQQVADGDFVYDGTAKTVSVSVAADSLVYAGDSCTVTASLTQGADNVSAGTFTFTATSLGNGNYRLPGTAQSPVYTIAPKEIVIDWAADDFTYTGGVQTISASYKDVEGREVQLAVTTDRPFLGAGSYTARAAFAGGETNYTLPESPVCVFTMQKATYDMSGVSFADGTFVEDGTAKSLSVAGSLPDGVTVVYDNNGQTASGVYTVTARFVYDTDNYNALSPMTATLTVNRAQLTAQADESADSPDVIVTADNGLAPDLQLVITLSDEVDETAGNEIGRQERSAGVYDVRLLSDGIDVQPDGEIVLRLLSPTVSATVRSAFCTFTRAPPRRSNTRSKASMRSYVRTDCPISCSWPTTAVRPCG